MLRICLCILLVQAEGLELPFWKAKEKAYQRVQNGEVLVSVKTAPPNLVIAGGGQVRAPRDFTYDFAKDFTHIEHLGIYVDKAHYEPAQKTVALTFSALGRTADFLVKVESFDREEPRRIAFAIVEGPLKGLRADLRFFPLARADRCDVGIDGEYAYAQAPLPKWMVGLGMEVVFQKMALRLREQVQKAYADRPGK